MVILGIGGILAWVTIIFSEMAILRNSTSMKFGGTGPYSNQIRPENDGKSDQNNESENLNNVQEGGLNIDTNKGESEVAMNHQGNTIGKF